MRTASLFTASVIIASILGSCSGGKKPAELVNVLNGSDLAGNTYPAATVPFGAVQLGPDTSPDRTSGYHYKDTVIVGFSHNRLSGTGCPDFGDFLFTPTLSGKAEPLAFTHENETAHPGYYKVDFPAGITAEMTADVHTGAHRYTFNGAGIPRIQVDAKYCIGWWSSALKAVLKVEGPNEISGERQTRAWAHGRDSYFSAEFSVPFEKVETIEDGKLMLSFPEGTKEITVMAGLSGVSLENAKANRIAETGGASFDDVLAKATSVWDNALGQIRVEGGPVDVFYTFFYHTFATPNRIDDVDGSYRNFKAENTRVEPGRYYYSTLSLWDTFRSWHPLQTILDPKLVSDIITSMLDMYDCTGELPVWPLSSFETSCMIGYHSVSVIADAWLGMIADQVGHDATVTPGFDGERALEAMVTSSNHNEVNTAQLYAIHGFVPADLKGETGSRTLEYAYDDWCIARMAEALGHKDLAEEYYHRALSYQELFDPQSGFMRGKRLDGGWVRPLDPLARSRDFTEATPWQYRFFVPHDLAGMEYLLGGREAMLAAVDSLFNYRPQGQASVDGDIGGIRGQYAQGNEPGHALPWLYYWLGEPSKSQEVVRWLLENTYSSAPDGVCGNEDCGQMSAWYVLASLGIYPACPGTGQYILTAPLFKKSEIRLGNGKTLTIKADHPEYAYVSDVTLNGEPVDQHYLTYGQIMDGGVLEFKLSSKPDHSRDALPAPYSMTTGPIVSKPAITGDLLLFEGETEVAMSCRNEGAEIHYTLDGSVPSVESPAYIKPFKLDKSCVIKARAFKEGLGPSPVNFITAHKKYYYPITDKSGLKPGVLYTYHAANFKAVSQIEEDPEEGWGIMNKPSIKDTPDEDHFAYNFMGYIDVPSDGDWCFAVTSDDGSELFVDGVRVVMNDGSHEPVTVTGKIPLQKGLHSFKLHYFDDTGAQELSWTWKKEGESKFRPIPKNILYYR